MTIEAVLQKFIVEDLLMGNGRGDIQADTSLINSGIIDSLSLIRLINFVEDHFKLTVDDDEVVPDNFETINSLKALISSKQKA